MTNMKVLEKSRRHPRVGDVFYLQVFPNQYHWGRVASTSTNLGGFKNCILVYIFEIQTPDCIEVPLLDISRLLIPPAATNRRPWTMGFFKHVKHETLKDGDMLSVHCFEDTLNGEVFQ